MSNKIRVYISKENEEMLREGRFQAEVYINKPTAKFETHIIFVDKKRVVHKGVIDENKLYLDASRNKKYDDCFSNMKDDYRR